jgi:hypothetical protein
MYLESFETTAEDCMEQCNWDKPLREKMRQPVAANGHDLFDSARARIMVDIAWFDDPHRPVEVSVWDAVAKEKMRQPVRPNGYHHLSNDELTRNLLLFSSWY